MVCKVYWWSAGALQDSQVSWRLYNSDGANGVGKQTLFAAEDGLQMQTDLTVLQRYCLSGRVVTKLQERRLKAAKQSPQSTVMGIEV